jgi:serine/threonine-protein kinase
VKLPLIAFVLVATTVAAAAPWKTYANDRFGATADYPAGWRAGEAPANNDGLVFTAPDGRATITISGSHSVLPRAQEIEIMTTPADGETVDYKSRGRDWIVLSGRRGDRIYYRRSLLTCHGTVWNTVSLDYPAAEKAAFDPIVAHVAASLRGARGWGTDCR